jgi:hypothetical protein
MNNKAFAIITSIIFLSIIPILGAYIYWHKQQHRPTVTTHYYGKLHRPAIQTNAKFWSTTLGNPTPERIFSNRWHLLYTTQNCGNTCQSDLKKLSAFLTAFGRDQSRLQINLLHFQPQEKNNSLRTFGPRLHRYLGKTQSWNGMQRKIKALPDLKQPHILLINPLSQWVMTYTMPANLDHLYHDLKRMLKYSTIG